MRIQEGPGMQGFAKTLLAALFALSLAAPAGARQARTAGGQTRTAGGQEKGGGEKTG